jgi:sn-glycerol 3-phosphate transport system ATP-binding protein
MAEIRLAEVGKIYAGGVEAVRNISLHVPDGAFCVLVGPSGCGKSTLLRMVAGLETITSGTVSLGGQIVNHLEPAQRDMAMVFQNYALYPHMRVYDNIAYGLRNRGTAESEIKARVAEAARILGLEDLLARKPRELSGGQRQRVAMGRAIVRNPQAFLFDEPLSNLDAKLRVQMRVEIRKLQKSLGITALYVTHDQIEAMTMSDLLVVMNKGSIEQAGTPLDIYHKPASLFVATFIGSPPMNILDGTAVEGNQVEVAGQRIRLARHFGLAAGQKVKVGIRPEHFHPAAHGFVTTVDLVESLGSSEIIHTDLGGQPLTLHAESGRFKADTQSQLVVGCEALHLHLFDPQSGRRLEERETA